MTTAFSTTKLYTLHDVAAALEVHSPASAVAAIRQLELHPIVYRGVRRRYVFFVASEVDRALAARLRAAA